MKRRTWNKRWKHPRVIILAVVLLSVLCTTLFLYINRTTDIDRLQMSILDKIDHKVIQDNVKTSFSDDFQIEDYGIYGQTLSFYQKKYGSKTTDSLVGTMVVLRNVETKTELSFAIGESADSGIQLGTLDDGLYEIYMFDNYEKKRVCFKEEMDSEPFSTIRNNKHVKDIRIHASKEYLSSCGIHYEKNYAFLEVNENIPQVKVADIVLDPDGNVYNEISMQNEAGIVNDWLNEPQETLEFAKLVKKELEEQGLRVLLTREDDSSVSYYGTSSRVAVGYKAKAKTFISFSFYEDQTLEYPYIIASQYTKGLLANEVAYALAHEGLNMQAVTDDGYLNKAVVTDSGQKPEGSKHSYDLYPQLRETGGKQTFAGSMDNSSANQSYQDAYGMESFVLMLGNGEKENSIQYYQEHKEQIAKGVTEAICSYYGIQGENSETASQ